MRVRATSLCYYGDMRRREGEVFELKPFKRKVKGKDGKIEQVLITPEMQFSEDCMELVDAKAQIKRPAKVKSPASEAYPPKEAGIARAAHEPRAEAEASEDNGDTVI